MMFENIFVQDLIFQISGISILNIDYPGKKDIIKHTFVAFYET